MPNTATGLAFSLGFPGKNGAGEGDRTLDPHVGNVMLYR